jgi:hypothetical protein
MKEIVLGIYKNHLDELYITEREPSKKSLGLFDTFVYQNGFHFLVTENYTKTKKIQSFIAFDFTHNTHNTHNISKIINSLKTQYNTEYIFKIYYKNGKIHSELINIPNSL